MAAKTLYISDLDGTLLNQNKEVSEYAKLIINAYIARGGQFSVATARTAASTCKILSGLNIVVPVILMNGAVVYDFHEDKYIKTEIICKEIANSILEVLNTHHISGFMYAIYKDKLMTYYENLESKAMRDFHDERVQKYYKTFEQVSSFKEKLVDNGIIYFALIDEFDQLLDVCNSLKNQHNIDMTLYKDIYEENLWYLEIYSIQASKFNAVNYLRKKGSYDRIIGFGDNHNDIPFLKACDEFYSVSNAVNELKELATATIDSNINDGVVKFLLQKESIILK